MTKKREKREEKEKETLDGMQRSARLQCKFQLYHLVFIQLWTKYTPSELQLSHP